MKKNIAINILILFLSVVATSVVFIFIINRQAERDAVDGIKNKMMYAYMHVAKKDKLYVKSIDSTIREDLARINLVKEYPAADKRKIRSILKYVEGFYSAQKKDVPQHVNQWLENQRQSLL